METTTIQIDEGWKHVQRGVRKLERLLEGLPESQFTAEEYMFLYSTIYDMCTQKPPNDYSKELYDRYKTTINTYIQKTVLPSLDNQHNNEFMLREVGSRWLIHKVFVKWLGKFFHYLDRFFIRHRSLPTLNQVGLQCFRDQIFVQAWSGRVRDVVIYVINQEREGVQIDRALLKNVVDIFIEIGLGSMDCYERDFEAHMLTDTSAYYSRKAASWILEDFCPDYIRKVEERLRQEKERVNNYLHSTTERKVLEIVERELLIKYQYQILEKENSGCDCLLRDDKKDDVCRLYKLFCRIPNGIEPVSFSFKQHITAQGTALVKQAEDAVTSKKVAAADKKLTVVGSPDQDFIKQLIAMLDKYVSYVTDCFQESSLFHKALKESFEVFCNKTVAGATTAELLATYSDNLLKKGANDKMTDEAVEETLENVVKILGYISDKDLFAEFYRKKLARRLIHERSASDDHDRSFLIKLRQQCGAQFTSKMEGMLNDLVLAKEHQAGYEHYVKEFNSTANPGVDFSVSILTTGFWPSYKFFDVNLPSEMVKCVTTFKEYYSNKTKQRKLTWIYSHGICNLNARFDTKSIELVVTTFQAITLMLFNTSQRLSYSEIRTQLNITDDDIIRLLHSLSCGKYKILSKEPNTKSISQSDYFEFNSKFTDKMRKIKIPLPPVSEQKKVIEDVQSDRRHAIDASLVQIMKSRKVMGHQQLVTECVEQLSRMFKPDFKVIKKRIEDLIIREYLERDQENPHVFKYLA